MDNLFINRCPHCGCKINQKVTASTEYLCHTCGIGITQAELIEFERLSPIEQEAKAMALQAEVEQTLQRYLQTATISSPNSQTTKLPIVLIDDDNELGTTAHELSDLLNAAGYQLSKVERESIKLNIRATKNNTTYQFSVPFSTWKEILAKILPHVDALSTAGDFFRIWKHSTWK